MATSTPSLAAALAKAAADDKRGQVERLLDDMDPADSAVLLDALNGPLSAKRISGALDEFGHKVGRNAIDGWRSRHAAR